MKEKGTAGGPVCPGRLGGILLDDRQARGSTCTKIHPWGQVTTVWGPISYKPCGQTPHMTLELESAQPCRSYSHHTHRGQLRALDRKVTGLSS